MGKPGITAGGVYLFDISIDSSGNVYVCGTDESRRNFVAKYNNSGVIQWQRTLQGYFFGEEALGVGTDSSNNVYIGGMTRNGNQRTPFVAKYNGSGTIQYAKEIR